MNPSVNKETVDYERNLNCTLHPYLKLFRIESYQSNDIVLRGNVALDVIFLFGNCIY